MATGSTPPVLPSDLPPAEAVSSFARMRESLADSVFQVSRVFPKLLKFSSTPRAWTLLRIALGVVGAALVVLPLGLWNAWAFAPVGLALFMLAVLLPPLRKDRGTAKAAAQLGAYLVLDGGTFGQLPENPEAAREVNFYVSQSRVWVLDNDLRPAAVIPADEISLVTAFPSQQDWSLRVRWREGSAEFVFDGLFAERRARLAEAGLRHLVQNKELPARARGKAAGA
ncbi:MAG TPA: hypothetical protein VMT51_10295 [Dongiaceae bacterium]|nr:hypothetical protein [Dongiaceae bacterium]